VLLVTAAVLPRVLMAAVDRCFGEQASPLLPFAVVLSVLALLRAAAAYAQREAFGRLAAAVEADLRRTVMADLVRLPAETFQRLRTGNVVSRAHSDVLVVRQFLEFLPGLVVTTLTLVVAVGLMVTIHLPLTLLALLTFPLILATAVSMRARVVPTALLQQARSARAASAAEEAVVGAEVVRSLVAEAHFASRYAVGAGGVRWAGERLAEVRSRYTPVLLAWPRLGVAAVLAVGGWQVIEGGLTVGGLLAFTAYLGQLASASMMLGFAVAVAQQAGASAQRVLELRDLPAEPRDGDATAPRGAVEVELRGVRVGFGDGPDVLAGVDLHVPAGELLVITGAVGSGKSALLSTLPRLCPLRAGRVLVDGRDVTDLDAELLRRRMALVDDEPVLLSGTLEENLRWTAPDATEEQLHDAVRLACLDELVRDLPEGLGTRVGERGSTLSGGQRQRVGIARALLARPDLLLLDDATSALDATTERDVLQNLRRARQGTTTVIVSHRPAVLGLADRVLRLEGGRLVPADERVGATP
jgi:ATP-binding cassette subfamily B protein